MKCLDKMQSHEFLVVDSLSKAWQPCTQRDAWVGTPGWLHFPLPRQVPMRGSSQGREGSAAGASGAASWDLLSDALFRVLLACLAPVRPLALT